jgi:hypothetical protein
MKLAKADVVNPWPERPLVEELGGFRLGQEVDIAPRPAYVVVGLDDGTGEALVRRLGVISKKPVGVTYRLGLDAIRPAGA